MPGPERRRLTDEELAALADEPPGGLAPWRVVTDDGTHRLVRDLEFADFVEAFSFMAAVALVAERLDHHPDWSNSYRSVHVELTTHDLGGIGTLDVALARRIEELAGRAAQSTPMRSDSSAQT